MSKETSAKASVSGGISFGSVLFLVFLTLKLTHFINWSWWWVTAPMWIPVGIALAVIFFCLAMALIAEHL
jgi:hypothetical protein